MPDTRPNIVLIFPDQWRGDCLSSLGHPAVDTPHLDLLAEGGVTFASAYSACPSCIAARASLATGQTPSTCGRMGYRDRVVWTYRDTMYHCLRDGGYQTMSVGKTHFFPQRLRLGFEEMAHYDTQNFDPGYISDYHAWLRKETGGLVRDTPEELSSNAWLAHPWTHGEHLHPSTWTTSAAIDLIERRDPLRPFFMQIGYHRPHPPIDPPVHYYNEFADRELPPVPVGGWAEKYDRPTADIDAYHGRIPDHRLDRSRRAYYAQLAHLDHQVGRLVRHLKLTGQLNNTWIIFTSDHGELLGDHHLFRKFNAFEGSAKIPFIVRPPAGVDAARNTRRTEPVTLMDIMPTVLEEAEIDVPEAVEGRSLSPLIRGKDAPWREFVHGEHAPGMGGWQFVTDGREKFIWETESGREWFFDLANDPQELNDLADDPKHASRVSAWRTRLIEVLAERPGDGLTDGQRLIAGTKAPAVRDWVLEASEEAGLPW